MITTEQRREESLLLSRRMLVEECLRVAPSRYLTERSPLHLLVEAVVAAEFEGDALPPYRASQPRDPIKSAKRGSSFPLQGRWPW
jgi:hypothetical protein